MMTAHEAPAPGAQQLLAAAEAAAAHGVQVAAQEPMQDQPSTGLAAASQHPPPPGPAPSPRLQQQQPPAAVAPPQHPPPPGPALAPRQQQPPAPAALTAEQQVLVTGVWNGFWSGHLPHGRASFIRIWKAANNNIMANLDAWLRPRGVELEAQAEPERAKGLCTYTFVREPVARFASAYNEFEWRLAYEPGSINFTRHHTPRAAFVQQPLGSVARVRAFLSDLVEFRAFPGECYRWTASGPVLVSKH